MCIFTLHAYAVYLCVFIVQCKYTYVYIYCPQCTCTCTFNIDKNKYMCSHVVVAYSGKCVIKLHIVYIM